MNQTSKKIIQNILVACATKTFSISFNDSWEHPSSICALRTQQALQIALVWPTPCNSDFIKKYARCWARSEKVPRTRQYLAARKSACCAPPAIFRLQLGWQQQQGALRGIIYISRIINRKLGLNLWRQLSRLFCTWPVLISRPWGFLWPRVTFLRLYQVIT